MGKKIREGCKSLLAVRVGSSVIATPMTVELAKSIVNLGWTTKGLLDQKHSVLGILISLPAWKVNNISLGRRHFGWFSDNYIYGQKNWTDTSIPATIFINNNSFVLRVNDDAGEPIALNEIRL